MNREALGLGPERMIDPAVLPVPHVQGVMASNGTDFAVAWGRAITRVKGDGTVLDPTGLAVPWDSGHPPWNVVFDGTDYVIFVGYVQNGNPSVTFRVFRMTPGGVFLDPQGIQIPLDSAGNKSVWGGAIGCGSNQCLVTWGDMTMGGPTIFAARIAANGTILDPQPFIVDTTAPAKENGVVAFNGTDYVLFLEGTDAMMNEVEFTLRVGQDGTVRDPLPNTFRMFSGVGSAAWSGSAFLAEAVSGSYGVRRFGANGVPLDNGIGLAPLGMGQQTCASASVVWDGTQWAIAVGSNFVNVCEYFVMHIDAAGMVADTVQLPVQGPTDQRAEGMQIAIGAGGYFVTAMTDKGLLGMRMDRQFNVLGTSLIGMGANDESAPVLAATDGQYLAVWAASPSTPVYPEKARLYAARVGADGVPLDVPPIEVEQTHPTNFALGTDRSRYFIGWYSELPGQPVGQNEVRVARMDPRTGLMDPGGLLIGTGLYASLEGVLSGNGRAYVSWWDGIQELVTIVDHDGTTTRVTGPDIPLGNLAFAGKTGLSADTYPVQGGNTSIVVSLFDANLNVLKPKATILTIPFDRPGSCRPNRLIFDGTNFVLAFVSSSGIQLLRIDQQGNPVDRMPVVSLTGTRDLGGLVFDGSAWVVESDGSYWRISPAGQLLTPKPVRYANTGILTPSQDYCTRSTIAGFGSGHVLAAYAPDFPAPPYQAHRVMVRALEWKLPGGGACMTNDDCESAMCAIGVCAPVILDMSVDDGANDGANDGDVDGGASPDAGAADAAAADAGWRDGPVTDGAGVDAENGDSERIVDRGCSCDLGRGAGEGCGGMWLVLGMAVLIRVKRRRGA